MKIRIHNNDSTDYIDYEGNNIEEIREQAKDRLAQPSWKEGWSEEIK